MGKKKEIIEIQEDMFNDAFTDALEETTENCVKRYGHVNAGAICVSLSHMFAASLASLTLDYSKKEEKQLYNAFFERVVEEAHEYKKELVSPNDLFKILNVDKGECPS